MTRFLALTLVVSTLALSACSSTDQGKTYPAPYAPDRTAGGPAPAAEPVFEQKMTK